MSPTDDRDESLGAEGQFSTPRTALAAEKPPETNSQSSVNPHRAVGFHSVDPDFTSVKHQTSLAYSASRKTGWATTACQEHCAWFMVQWETGGPPTPSTAAGLPPACGWWAGANWGRTGSSERKTGCGQELIAGRRLCNQKQRSRDVCSDLGSGLQDVHRSNWERPPGCGSRTRCSASCPAAHLGAAVRVPPLPIRSLRSLSDKTLPVLQIPGMEKNQVDDDNIREKATKVTGDRKSRGGSRGPATREPWLLTLAAGACPPPRDSRPGCGLTSVRPSFRRARLRVSHSSFLMGEQGPGMSYSFLAPPRARHNLLISTGWFLMDPNK